LFHLQSKYTLRIPLSRKILGAFSIFVASQMRLVSPRFWARCKKLSRSGQPRFGALHSTATCVLDTAQRRVLDGGSEVGDHIRASQGGQM
jgi:hypothetical protein